MESRYMATIHDNLKLAWIKTPGTFLPPDMVWYALVIPGAGEVKWPGSQGAKFPTKISRYVYVQD